MRVLHIAGGFGQQSLYLSLVQSVAAKGHWQFVFAPVRSGEELDRQPEDQPGVVQYHFDRVLHPWHRILFRTKINAIQRRLLRCFDPMKADLIHAHTLYSDGAVALALARKFGLPYVAAVRNTDVNFFMRLRPDLRRVMERVIMHAQQIIFISPAYREALLGRFAGELREKIEHDSVVIPNGLDDFWLEESPERVRSSNEPLRLLFVGSFTRAKNVQRILRAVEIVSQHRLVELNLVGSGGSCERRIRGEIASGKFPFARWVGRITDRATLRKVYRDNDIFVMPSIRETFGVVYLEALSQGLPVIYSEGQGIDGYFEAGTVGEAVDPRNLSQIAATIELLAEGLDSARSECRAQARRFAWIRVAAQYDDIYCGAVSEKQ